MSTQKPVFQYSALCNAPPVILIPCLYIGAYTLLGKKPQIFEMSAMKKILEVPPFTTEKGWCLHTVASVLPHLSGSSHQEHAHTARFTPCALKLRMLAFPRHRCYPLMQQDSGFYIHLRRKVTDITNAASRRGIWHSEYAKKLTLMNCYNSLSSLKKRSLHILKYNDPRESWSALSFLLLTSDDL